MGRISEYLNKHIEAKYNLTVNVSVNEGVVKMSKETFDEIMTDQAQLIYANIFYGFIILFVVVGFCVVISLP